MKYVINGINKINDKIIDDSIFQEEKVEYVIAEREDLIDHLIDWISEATRDKETMKRDLKYLISLNDKYILSSIISNDYVTEEKGQDILEEIYKI